MSSEIPELLKSRKGETPLRDFAKIINDAAGDIPENKGKSIDFSALSYYMSGTRMPTLIGVRILGQWAKKNNDLEFMQALARYVNINFN